MSYITVEELQDFAHKYAAADELDLQQFIDGAEEAIRNYLGYDPNLIEYTSIIRSSGGKGLALKARPIVELNEIWVGNYKTNEKDFLILDDTNFIEHRALIPFDKDVLYKVVYKAGFENVPQIIKMTALQIACLMWESGAGQLAVTSTSFADAGTRTFNNFTMDRFLKQIDAYRIYVK